jgi:hypothetical protein
LNCSGPLFPGTERPATRLRFDDSGGFQRRTLCLFRHKFTRPRGIASTDAKALHPAWTVCLHASFDCNGRQKKRPEGRCGTAPFGAARRDRDSNRFGSENAEDLQGNDGHDRHAAQPENDAFHDRSET